MSNTWSRPRFARGTVVEDAIWASTLIVTIVSILALIFAVITQGLAWIGGITLSTTQQVTIWLVVVVLIVLLSIAYMACRTYATMKMYVASVAGPQNEPETQGGKPPNKLGSQDAAPQDEPQTQEVKPPDRPGSQDAAPRDEPMSPTERLPANPPGGPPPPSSVSSKDGNPRGAFRLPATMADVFPHGCYLVHGSISEAEDCDDSLDIRPVVDKITGNRVFSCRVTDMHPELKGQPRQTVVKVVTEQMPVLPSPADGSPFTAIEFEGLTAASCEINHGRAAYSSLRATGIAAALVPGSAQERSNDQ